GVCNGDAVVDCAGACNGNAVEDCAGVCNGNAQEDCAGECNGNAQEDCAGACNGNAVEDCAGACNGDAVVDCAGVCNGDAVVDCAGACNGNAQEDCAGVCNGDAVVDCAGACNGNAQEDCAGVCNGDAVVDCAGACNGNAQEDCAGVCNGHAVEDCAGACNGNAVEECAGVCNGDAVVDCAGACNGNAVEDCAGVCNGDAVVDCAGACNGNAREDCAGVCNGDAVVDCAGACNGNAVEDCAGVCNGDAVVDCAGVCGGDAEPNPNPEVHVVTTQGFDFNPENLTIAIGDIVEFQMPGNHNAIEVSEDTYNRRGSQALPGGFEVGFGQTRRITFDQPGTYYYVCSPHAGFGMIGTITVEGGCCPADARDCDGVCNGDAQEDCAGECNGNAQEDCAGVCNGDAQEDCAGVCNGDAQRDCAGVCNGQGVVDCLGVCNGTANQDAGGCCQDLERDCAGVCNGDAVVDRCGVCDNDVNNDCVADCAGVFGGDAVEDCAGECGGNAAVDLCGNCGGNNTAVLTINYSIANPNNVNAVTFASTLNGWNGEPMTDEDGDGIFSISVSVPLNVRVEYKAIVDGVWEGGANRIYDVNQQWALDNQCTLDGPTHCWSAEVQAPNGVTDNCGVCDADPNNDCAADCNGDFGGQAVEDGSGGCCLPADQDCAGICNGQAATDANGACCTPDKLDCAGVCEGPSVTDDQGVCCLPDAQDCAGICNGNALTDMCGVCDDDQGNDCECSDAMPCNGNQVCDQGQCVDPVEPNCDENNPCQQGQICENGACVDQNGGGEPNAVDFCKLQWVDGFQGNAGDRLRIDVQPQAQFNVYGRLYEGNMTDVTTGYDQNPLIIAQVGYGPNGTNPNDPFSAAAWTWFDAQGNANWDGTLTGDADDRGRDEYFGQITAPINPNSYSFSIRFSVDGGQTYLACDGGAGSDNGFQSIEAGRFTVLAQACEDELDCPVPDDPNCIAFCSADATCGQLCQVDGCPDPTSEFVVYASGDSQECNNIPDLQCGQAGEGFVSFDTHCGCGCIDPNEVEITCREGEFKCNDNTCIPMNWVCDDQAFDCAGGEDEAPNNCPACRVKEDCQGNQVCDPVTFECVDPPPCNGDGDCDDGFACDPATNQCVERAGCAGDADCGQNEVCDLASTQCIARCLDDADCDGERVCDANTGQCVDPPENNECDAGFFTCADGSACVESQWVCEPGANPWQDCGDGSDETQAACAWKNALNCQGDGDCNAGQRCDVATGQCVDNGCLNDNDCAQGEICDPQSEQCVAGGNNGCGNDADCNGQQCVNDVCQVCDPADNAGCNDPQKGICLADGSDCVECSADANCGNGQICFQNECRNQGEVCFGDADCANGQICVDNACAAGCPSADDPTYESVTQFSADPNVCADLPGQLGVNNMEEAAVMFGCSADAQVYDLVCGCGCFELAGGGDNGGGDNGGGDNGGGDNGGGDNGGGDNRACVTDNGFDGWLCDDGIQCISADWRCDEWAGDCNDGSDEANCGGGGDNGNNECAPGLFECVDGSGCIEPDWVCENGADPWSDCTDGSDETDAACTWKANQL
ncbi:MAG: plastocyanin/azurin family copper-binding protein, partial [Myxococcota bacterium]|nr:plastocyanin/azurin family copper-binding protein [Myxococcota bacterium]